MGLNVDTDAKLYTHIQLHHEPETPKHVQEFAGGDYQQISICKGPGTPAAPSIGTNNQQHTALECFQPLPVAEICSGGENIPMTCHGNHLIHNSETAPRAVGFD